jgi:hypothetical protein
MSGKMYRWVVAFNVADTWVADGFDMSDARAEAMISREIGSAYKWETSASVIAAPSPIKVVREQGYSAKHAGAGAEVKRVQEGTPNAGKLDQALVKAIELLDSVAFVREEGDNTQEVLAMLRDSLTLIRG